MAKNTEKKVRSFRKGDVVAYLFREWFASSSTWSVGVVQGGDFINNDLVFDEEIVYLDTNEHGVWVNYENERVIPLKNEILAIILNAKECNGEEKEE